MRARVVHRAVVVWVARGVEVILGVAEREARPEEALASRLEGFRDDQAGADPRARFPREPATDAHVALLLQHAMDRLVETCTFESKG